MNGQVVAYVALSTIAGGAWVALGVLGRRLWDRTHNAGRRK